MTETEMGCTKYGHEVTYSQRTALSSRVDQLTDKIAVLTKGRDLLAEMLRLPVCLWRNVHVEAVDEYFTSETYEEVFNPLPRRILRRRGEHDGEVTETEEQN